MMFQSLCCECIAHNVCKSGQGRISAFRYYHASQVYGRMLLTPNETKTAKYYQIMPDNSIIPEVSASESLIRWKNSLSNPENALPGELTRLQQRWNQGQVKTSLECLAEDEEHMFSLQVQNADNQNSIPYEELPGESKNLIMLSGYGSGFGAYYNNFLSFASSQKNVKIHVVDVPDFGLSTNAKRLDVSAYESGVSEFPIQFDFTSLRTESLDYLKLKVPETYTISQASVKNYDIDHVKNLVESVENRYIQSIERYVRSKGLKNFTLLGHSLGGYIALAYALKHPDRVSKLILVSPAGIERSPFAVTNPNLRLQGDVIRTPSTSPTSYDFLGRYPMSSDWQRKLYKAGMTKYKLLGPLGYGVFYKAKFRKLMRSWGKDVTLAEFDDLINYLYLCEMSVPSSFLPMQIFSSSLHAKYPMFDRLKNLRVNKTLWLYGDHDFMYNKMGKLAVLELQREGKDSVFKTIPRAGHNLYLDNYEDFNKAVKAFLNWN